MNVSKSQLTRAKMKTKKQKGRSPNTPDIKPIICGDVVYLDEYAIISIKQIFKNR